MGLNRLLQFRLRTLLVGTAVVAVWLANMSAAARNQRMVVAQIRAVGGSAYFQHELEESGHRYWQVASTPKRPMLAPLSELIGPDFVYSVVYVDLDGTSADDSILPVVGSLPDLHTLRLVKTKVSLAGLKQFHAGNPDCEWIAFDWTQEDLDYVYDQ